MIEQRWMIILGILLALFLSYEAFADDHIAVETLSVKQDSAEAFAGTYQVAGNRVSFQSDMVSSEEVLFSIDINGEKRKATYTMDGRQLTLSEYEALSAEEQDLMFDAMNAVSDYYQDHSNNVYSPALVLVSAMGYWSHR